MFAELFIVACTEHGRCARFEVVAGHVGRVVFLVSPLHMRAAQGLISKNVIFVFCGIIYSRFSSICLLDG